MDIKTDHKINISPFRFIPSAFFPPILGKGDAGKIIRTVAFNGNNNNRGFASNRSGVVAVLEIRYLYHIIIIVIYYYYPIFIFMVGKNRFVVTTRAHIICVVGHHDVHIFCPLHFRVLIPNGMERTCVH